MLDIGFSFFYSSHNWARQAVGEAQSDQSTRHVKPLYLHDFPNDILQISLKEEKYATVFYFKDTKSNFPVPSLAI